MKSVLFVNNIFPKSKTSVVLFLLAGKPHIQTRFCMMFGIRMHGWWASLPCLPWDPSSVGTSVWEGGTCVLRFHDHPHHASVPGERYLHYSRMNPVTHRHLTYSVCPACMTCWGPFKLSSGSFNFEPELDPGRQMVRTHHLQIALPSFLKSYLLLKIFLIYLHI